jgi:hypothetical protein
VVSFAVKSLGGREKGMAETYRRQFLELAGKRRWVVCTLGFETELAFVVQCGCSHIQAGAWALGGH